MVSTGLKMDSKAVYDHRLKYETLRNTCVFNDLIQGYKDKLRETADTARFFLSLSYNRGILLPGAQPPIRTISSQEWEVEETVTAPRRPE